MSGERRTLPKILGKMLVVSPMLILAILGSSLTRNCEDQLQWRRWQKHENSRLELNYFKPGDAGPPIDPAAVAQLTQRQQIVPLLDSEFWEVCNAEYERVPVLKVIDGDTIVVLFEDRETWVRMLGVDTAEADDTGSAKAERFTRNMLSSREAYLTFEPGGAKYDEDHRLLAYVWAERGSLTLDTRKPLQLNAALVERGLGRTWDYYPSSYRDEYHRLEEKARDAGKGNWAAIEETQVLYGGWSEEAGANPRVITLYKEGYYHRPGCRELWGEYRVWPLAEATENGFEPCPLCNPPVWEGNQAAPVEEPINAGLEEAARAD